MDWQDAEIVHRHRAVIVGWLLLGAGVMLALQALIRSFQDRRERHCCQTAIHGGDNGQKPLKLN